MLSSNFTKTLLCFLLITLALSQNSPIKSNFAVNLGQWLNSAQSKESTFPRYLICGAEMNNFKMTMPFACDIAKSKEHDRAIKTQCVGGKTMWDRANGIRFKYCNFQNWYDQKSNQFYGSYQWLGMKMCPKDQYVYNYVVRINEIDGLNGLTIMCRNKFTGETSTVTVKDGKAGTFFGPEPYKPEQNQFAFDFNIKRHIEGKSIFLTGLSLNFTPFPYITNIEIQYDVVTPPQVNLQYRPLQKDTLSNKESKDPKQQTKILTIDVNKKIADMQTSKKSQNAKWSQVKHFYYIFYNNNGKYHSTPLQKYMRPNTPVKVLMPVVRSKIQEVMDIDRMVVLRSVTLPSDFQFYKIFNQMIPNYKAEDFQVPLCYQMEVSTSIYGAFINNPYTISVTYTSNSETYVQRIRGVFQANFIGKPELFANYKYICD